MLNNVIIMGRLTKDPELRHTTSDVPVVSFTLACDRGYQTNGQSVDFINIVAWRGTAEFVVKWFKKGQLVAVSGRLQVRTYKDRDGNNRSATEVVADEVFFAERGTPHPSAVPTPSPQGEGFGMTDNPSVGGADTSPCTGEAMNPSDTAEPCHLPRGLGGSDEGGFEVSEWGEIADGDLEPLPWESAE